MIVTLLIFALLPALLGYAAHVYQTPERRSAVLTRVTKLKLWTLVDYLLAAFFASTGVLYAAGFLLVMGFKVPLTTLLSLLAGSCISALAYLVCYWQLVEKIKKHLPWLKPVLGAFVVAVGTFSKIYSDSTIAELTHLAPQDLPGAQLFLTLIITPIIWLGLGVRVIGYASLPLMGVLFLLLLRDFLNDKHTLAKSTVSNAGALFAVFIFVIALLSVVGKVARKEFYMPRLEQAIAYSAFHLPTTYCGLADIQGVTVAPMADSRAALAIPDGTGRFRFESVKCKPSSKTSEEITELLGTLTSNKARVSSLEPLTP